MKRTILIVDDQEINRKLLRKILSDDYNVMEAEDGEKAIKILQSAGTEVSAILLDLVMPVMNGYAVLNALSQNPLLSSIPILVTTGADIEDAELKALELGAHDFIPKPYNKDILLLRLDNLIKRAEFMSSKNDSGDKNDLHYIDYLTKTYNRAGFYRALEKLIKANPSKQYILICCNIRNFKAVNELYGASIGDELLKKVSAGICRENPLLNGRLDADRFMLCIERGDVDVDTLVSYSKNTFSSGSVSFSYMLRFGIYMVKDNTMAVNAMCDRAKAAIKNINDEFFVPYAIWNESMREEIVNQGIFANNLLPALAENQFEVYYQPIVDAKTQKIASAEALIRWHHPKMGFISPAKFISVFEKNASIAKLDNFVGITAASLVAARLRAGKTMVPVSVNASRMDFHCFDISQVVQQGLEQAKVPAKYLKLEITESTYAIEPQKIFDSVRVIREQGICVLLDDFGSGYSSFNSLQNIDVDIIKMDMRFMKGFHENKRCRIIAKSVINMAHELGSQVVAEGVETREEYEFLRDTGCDFIQGFYFYKPMPEAEFERLLDNE